MAEIYKQFAGTPSGGAHGSYEDPLNYVLSHHIETQNAIQAEVMSRTAIARSQLAKHRAAGHSSISSEIGDVDGVIWLTDHGTEGAYSTNPMTPVYAIEFGRAGGRGGARPLTAAFPEVML